MKTIAFVCPWYGDNIPGGAEAALRGIADHLHEAGMKIEILTTTVKQFTADWNENYYKPGDYTSQSGIPIKRFKIRKRDVKTFDAVNAKLMKGERINNQEEEIFLKEMINSPDLYNYIDKEKDNYSFFMYIPYLFGTTYYGIKACPEKSVMIPCFHDESYVYINKFIELYSQVAGMLFNAQPEYDLTDRIYDLTNVKAHVMGLGVDTNLTYDAERFRKKFGIKDPFILYAGRKDKGKNIYTLLNYYRNYKKTHNNDLKLVLIGGGEIDIPSDISDEVYDLGFVDIQDKYDGYGAATILCQPSKTESFSFVIMESWLCNRPVLVHEGCPVTKNFAIESNGGLYFANYNEFEGTVEYMLNHPDIADQMGKNGHDYVMNHFAWDVIVAKYRKFLEELEAGNRQ